MPKYAFKLVFYFIALFVSTAHADEPWEQSSSPQYATDQFLDFKNDDFLEICNATRPTVYNPSIKSRRQGGGSTRYSTRHLVNSIEMAAANGHPVTVAMDYTGEFGAACNFKNKNGSVTRNCLLLVYLPGLDKQFPEYKIKFSRLPTDSFLGLVEDTGGDFIGKGTTRIDIPIIKDNYNKRNSFTRAEFEILTSEITNLSQFRKQDLSQYNPLAEKMPLKCDWRPKGT